MKCDGGIGNHKKLGEAAILNMESGIGLYVSQQRDRNGIPLARKSMLMCGLSLCLNGTWD